MKTPLFINTLLFAGVATVSWSLSPMLCAQNNPTDNTNANLTQGSKTSDSVADKNSAATSTTQTGSHDKASTKDPTSLDKNPSTAPTDSANQSATKDPTTVTTIDKDNARKESAENAAPRPVSDNEFVAKAAEGGMTEVELGKLAQEKGSSADVKQFGSHMVMDHSKANDDLKAIAAKNGMTVPTTLDEKHQAEVNRLSALSGPAFDKAYVHTMVSNHEKTAADFRMESKDGKNADVKNFASSTLPTIENHLADVKGLESKLK
jgi:putative membrane protein